MENRYLNDRESSSSELLPYRIVLFVVRTAAITGQPLQCNGCLGSVGRDVVRRMRLRALDDQMSGRHYCGHLVARDTVIVTEIGFPEVFYCNVSTVNAVTAFRQRCSVSLYTAKKTQSFSPRGSYITSESLSDRALTLCHWIFGFCVPSASCASQYISTDSLIFLWYMLSGSTVNVGGFLTNTSI